MNDLARVESESRGTLFLVRVVGEVDLSNADEVSAAIEAAVPNNSHTLVLDLTRTTYLDSTGVALLFRLAQRLQPRRQQLRLLVPADSHVRPVLELTGVPNVIPVQTHLEASPDEGG